MLWCLAPLWRSAPSSVVSRRPRLPLTAKKTSSPKQVPSLLALSARAVLKHELKSAWAGDGCLPVELVRYLEALDQQVSDPSPSLMRLRLYGAVDPASDDSMAFDEGNRMLTNPNAAWVAREFRWCYFVTIVFVVLFLRLVCQLTWAKAWTVTNMVHFVISFVVFHALKGNFGTSQCRYCDAGEYDTLTLWEQIDGGQKKSYNRTFFIAVVVMMLLMTMHATAHDPGLLMTNASSAIVLLIAKHPNMMYLRLYPVYDVDHISV